MASIVVVGGGTMGSGIAASFLASGADVAIVERDDDAAASARARVESSLARMAKRREDLDVAATLSRFTTATSHADEAADLVIEAVPEDLELKRAVMATLDHTYPSATMLATNTSSLSITSIADALADPGRLCGMHFFNPVPVSELVEIVRGEKTRPDVVDAARGYTEMLAKTPIVVADSPGFASSRLGLALGLEAIRMVESGVASADDIDTAMVLGYKHPIGPLRLTDLVGLDVRLAIAEHLASQLGGRFEPPNLLREMVAAGKLGKKTGQGFHSW